jgi:hypothetical protein
VHGGPDKAVYVYPAEHYVHWHRELPDMTLPWGMFGENLTTEGLLEDVLRIGDRFRIGTTEVREKVRESEQVSSFHVAPADGQPLPPYLPDQYVTVRLAIPGVERPVVRSYSLFRRH